MRSMRGSEEILFVALPTGLAVLMRIGWSRRGPHILAWLLLSAPVSAQTTQVQVLEMFYAATNGAGWTTKANWMSGSDPCTTGSTWHGVTCSGGEVTSLSLIDNGLTGTLPTQVGLLTAITEWL